MCATIMTGNFGAFSSPRKETLYLSVIILFVHNPSLLGLEQPLIYFLTHMIGEETEARVRLFNGGRNYKCYKLGQGLPWWSSG